MQMTGPGMQSFESGNPPPPDAEQDPPEVAAYLSRISWGLVYPAELLAIGEREQEAVSGLDQEGQTTPAKGLREQTRLRSLRNTNVGKQELAASREVDIHDLGEYAKRVLVLNYMFGGDWAEQNPTVISRRLSTMITYAAFMDKTFGRDWRTHSDLWTYSSATIQAKTDQYDRHLDPSWRTNLDLLTSAPRTVLSSARALPTLGLTPRNTDHSTYYRLLKTQLRTKQKNVVYMRSAILDHTQIRHSSQKRKIATLGARKARQTEADRETERAELQELRAFIADIGPKYLLRSTSAIAARAYNKGYFSGRSSSP